MQGVSKEQEEEDDRGEEHCGAKEDVERRGPLVDADFNEPQDALRQPLR